MAAQINSPKSPYIYETKPSFKRQISSLDIKAVTTFYGNLVISCTGRSPCDSKFSKLMLSITRNRGPQQTYIKEDDSKSSFRWSDAARMTVRDELWTKSEKLRSYFILLIENTGTAAKYQALYDNLCDEKYKISDDNAEFVLDSFVEMIAKNDEQILQCLSNYKCTHQSRSLWSELQANEIDKDELTNQQSILDKVDEVRSSPFYQDMLSSGIELDDNEILAVYIYCCNDEFADLMQKHLKIPCKWKQTFYYFVRAILKIYDCKVYGAKVEDLPSNLYHPVFLSYDEEKGIDGELQLLTTINCTSSKDAAQDFAPPDGAMFVIRNCGKALSRGELIGAPIDWISPHPNENEWVLMPCTFIECVKPIKYVHNSLLIDVERYETIKPTFFGVDIFTKLCNLQFVKDMNAANNGGAMTVVKDMKYYQQKCENLQAELCELRQQFGIDDSKQEEKAAFHLKKAIRIPFKKIADEAFLIRDDSAPDASMCVTRCDGELNPPFISAKGIKYLKANFESNELDIFVDTYAKCGTTVGIKMVYKILEANNKIAAGSNVNKLNDPWNAVPWIEVEVSQQLISQKSPNDFLSFVEHSNRNKSYRIWKSHQPFNNFPCKKIGKNSKIIHVIRNPKDVVCSYYDFFREEPLVNYVGSFETLFDWFCDGTVVHSSIFEFELNWFRALRNNILTDEQLLVISYEDIVRKPTQIIDKVGRFLGFTMSDQQISDISEAISFSKSKQEAKASSAISVIVNKGKIGRWKEILTKEQSDRIDRIINARLKDSNIQFTFQ